MKTKIIGFGMLVALVIVAGFGFNQYKSNPQTTLSAETVQYAATTVRIGDKSFNVELALTPDQQALGLGNRENLAKNSGMLFVFKPAGMATFWMKDMRFNLDMIWIKDGKVVEITHNAPAPNAQVVPADLPIYSANQTVDYVLEINAGLGDEIKVGDRVEVVDSSQV